MAREKINRVVERAQWGSILSTLVALAILVLTFWIGYTGMPGFRASVGWWVDFLGRPLAALLALGLLAVVGLLMLRFWGQIVRPLKWLYLWFLWQLVVRPARDHFDRMVSTESAGPVPWLGAELSKALVRMPDEVVNVFVAILDAYDYRERGRIEITVDSIWGLGDQPASWRKKKALAACENLAGRELVSQPRAWADGGGYALEVSLGPLLPGKHVLDVLEWAQEESNTRVRY